MHNFYSYISATDKMTFVQTVPPSKTQSRKTTLIDTTAHGHTKSLATVSYFTATVTITGTYIIHIV